MSENIWANFNEAQAARSNSSNSNSNSNKGNGSNTGAIQWNEFKNKVNQVENEQNAIVMANLNRVTLPEQEQQHIAKYVKDVYFTMYPEKEGDVYPSSWINTVIGYYSRIRVFRAKMLKSNPKDAMKGLNKFIVIGCIIRCHLVKENIPLPVPMLLNYLNQALKRSQRKQNAKPFTLEMLDRYRINAKKGIRGALSEYLPECYGDILPENLVDFAAFSLFKFTRQEVIQIRRLARFSGQDVFSDSTSPSAIAIGAIFTMCAATGKSTQAAQFGVTPGVLSNMYKAITESTSPRVQGALPANLPEPNVLFAKKK